LQQQESTVLPCFSQFQIISNYKKKHLILKALQFDFKLVKRRQMSKFTKKN